MCARLGEDGLARRRGPGCPPAPVLLRLSFIIFGERHDCTLPGVELVLILSECQDRALPSVGGKAQAAHPILQEAQKQHPQAGPRPQASSCLPGTPVVEPLFGFGVWIPQNLAGICSEGPG